MNTISNIIACTFLEYNVLNTYATAANGNGQFSRNNITIARSGAIFTREISVTDRLPDGVGKTGVVHKTEFGLRYTYLVVLYYYYCIY